LDQEIQRLPESFRSAFVLCVLEGQTVPAAAVALGVKEGTVSSRLTRARQRLQRQLSRRGIALSALLAALSVAEGASKAAVPAALAHATTCSGLLAAGVIPSHVAALAAGVARAMFLTKAKTATLVVVVAGLFATGAGVLTQRHLTAKEMQQATKESALSGEQEAKLPPTRVAVGDKDEKSDTIEVSGRVLDPDGKPFAGATLTLWTGTAKAEAPRTRATTGKDGRFRFAVRRAALQQATVVATAEGYGLDWVELPHPIPNDHEATLRLVRDDLPITGRFLNLEGRGIAGMEVQVRHLEKRADDGDLAPFIAAKGQWDRGNYIHGPSMKTLQADALPMAASAVTDADGRFRLTGFGRERVLHLKIHGKTIETAYVEVLTHPNPVTGLFTGNENDTAYGPTFERLFAPAKSIAGTVREKGTGKPLDGITVFSGRSSAKTDAQGRYQIDGIRKQSEYTVTAKGPPYFTATKSRVIDTPAFEPVVVDFDLERGLAIRGRLFNKATGKPVEGTVVYHAFEDNPHLKRGLGAGERVWAGADGSFALTGILGPGVLYVLADEDDFVKIAPPADWKIVPTINTIPQVAHALVRIDPSEKDLQTAATYEIPLEPAATVQATVVDPDGKPFTGYYVAGQTASPRVKASWLISRESPTFMVRGLEASRPRVVVLYSAEKKLGKAQLVRADEAGPLQVQLQPLSGFSGRVLDADGRPWSGLEVRATLSRRAEDFARLPVQLLVGGGWAKELETQTRTDAGGKFRLDGLLPGLKYTLTVSDGDAERPVFQRDEVSPPEAGRSEDLGDLRSKQDRQSPKVRPCGTCHDQHADRGTHADNKT
jgi:protocatechuate 3,4-dioxygenase beta subunit